MSISFVSPLLAFRWIKQSFKIVSKQPLALSGIVVFYLMALGLLSGLPYFGILISSIFYPFGIVLMTAAGQSITEGEFPTYAPLKRAFKDPKIRQGLIGIGILYATAIEVISLVFSHLAQAEVSQWVVKDGGLVLSSVFEHFPTLAATVAVLIYIPLAMAMWFSPMLIYKAHQTIGKSLFYSFFVFLRALPALFVLLLILGLFCILCGLALETLLVGLELGEYATFIVAPAIVIISTVCYASLWPIYQSVIEDRD